MLQAALPNGFRLRMLPRSVPAVFRQTGEIFYIGGTDVLPAPLEGCLLYTSDAADDQ